MYAFTSVAARRARVCVNYRRCTTSSSPWSSPWCDLTLVVDSLLSGGPRSAVVVCEVSVREASCVLSG